MKEEYSFSLAKYATDLRYDVLPAHVIEKAKTLFLDFLGVAFGGTTSESSKSLQALALNLGSGGNSTLFGSTQPVLSVWAVLANGAAAHSIELDDTEFGAMLHPSSAIISTALALAEENHSSGKAFITAVVAGYEVATRIAEAGVESCDERGFHPTGICNVFGAAVTASKLLNNASAEQISSALGVAGNQAAGIEQFLLDKSWTKHLHPGWAAHSGIVAAMLAKNGFIAERRVLEGSKGFLQAYYNRYQLERLTLGLGKDYRILEANIKPYACCARIHTAIDALLGIIKEHRVMPTEVADIVVYINSRDAIELSEPRELKIAPPSALEAQFSIPYALAVALLYQNVSLEEFKLEVVQSPEVTTLCRLVTVLKEPAYDKNTDVWPARVTLKTKEGEVFTKEVLNPIGSAQSPFSWEQMLEKYLRLGSTAHSQEKLNTIASYVKSTEQLADMREFGLQLR